jgi:hypothetical protein
MTGYEFSHWEGDIKGSTNPAIISMDRDKTITAVFAEPKVEGWLFMMYMDGDNNLDSALWADINEMEYGLYQLEQGGVDTSNIHFMILWDGYGSGNSALYELGPDTSENSSLSSNTLDHTSDKWWTGNEVNMGDGETVQKFLMWAGAKYPDYKNRMLMLSNHGGGPGKAAEIITKGVCWDDTNGHDYLSTVELREAIEDAGYGPGNTLSIIGFDVCMLGNIEESYEHRSIADVLVASPESEGGDGWEFNDWIPRMTGASMDKEDLSTAIVKSFRDNFAGYGGYYSYDTLSAVRLTEMENLKTAIDELAAAIMADNKESSAKSIMNGTVSYSYSYLHEFGEFCEDLENSSTMTPNIQSKAALAGTALGEAIIYAWADTGRGDYDGIGSDIKRGLSISTSLNLNPGGAYSELDFASGSNGWDELLGSW